MIEKEILLREKQRYNLPLFISKQEEKLLRKNCPVQKIIGYQILQDVHIDLSYNVLIPRYETEELILESYKYINKDSKVLDLGCGSGFIGLAIKKNINCDVDMVDISNAAIKQTKKNAKLNNLEVNVFKSNWFKKINNKYDLIISNPPYLNLKNTPYIGSLKYDPKKALYAKNSGFKHYETILKNAKKYLKESGHILFEVDDFIANMLKNKYQNIKIIKDINNKNRIAIIKYDNLE